MPKVEHLNALVGKYVNLEYQFLSGLNVQFLNDQTTYLGNQLESEFGGERCFGIIANMDFIMIATMKQRELILNWFFIKKIKTDDEEISLLPPNAICVTAKANDRCTVPWEYIAKKREK